MSSGPEQPQTKQVMAVVKINHLIIQTSFNKSAKGAELEEDFIHLGDEAEPKYINLPEPMDDRPDT